MTPSHQAKRTLPLISALSLALVAVAGCLDASEGLGVNAAPVATLEADALERYAGEAFRFDATDSADPDGDVVAYHFDFGDGTTFETTNRTAAANVTHAYETGGRYVVTLTVTDDGLGDANASRSGVTTTTVAVHERHLVAEAAQTAMPDAGVARTSFVTQDNVSAFHVNLTVQTLPGIGATTLTLRLLGANGTELANDTVTVSAGETVNVTFDGDLAEVGNLTLERHVADGAAISQGTLDVFYAAQPADPDAPAEGGADDATYRTA